MASTGKTRVLIVGATGQIGLHVINGLIESKKFIISAVVRPSSVDKPEVARFRSNGVEIRVYDLSDSATNFDEMVKNIDVVVSAIAWREIEVQKPLIDAAKRAGVKRFVPSDFATLCVKGVRELYDKKLIIRDYIKASGIGYTFIDVGAGMKFVTPYTEPSQANFPALYNFSHRMYEGGTKKNALIDGPDIGRFTALIIDDPRTLNEYVFCYGEEKTQKEMWEIVQAKTGKDVEVIEVSEEQLKKDIDEAREKQLRYIVFWEYCNSMFVRGDNTAANAAKAEYGAALDARQLYPDFKPRTYAEFVDEFYKTTI